MPRTWLITGCSSGFGRATAIKALGTGDNVIATSRNVTDLADLADRYPDTCLVKPLDVRSEDQIAASIAAGTERFGSIDVLLNNAGYGLVGALEECSSKQIDDIIDVNFRGMLRVTAAVLPSMRQQRSGRILSMSAVVATSNSEGFSVYGGCKAAMSAASDALGAELRHLGIHVTAIEPGPFRTDFVGRSLERADSSIEDYAQSSGKFAEMLTKIDGRQKGDPSRAADLIVRLASADDPPKRLALGRYAVNKAIKAYGALRDDIEAWKDLSVDTDFVRRPA